MSDLTDMVWEEVRTMGPATAAQIAGGLGIKTHTAVAALRSLERAGRVESEDYQHTRPVFMVAEDSR